MLIMFLWVSLIGYQIFKSIDDLQAQIYDLQNQISDMNESSENINSSTVDSNMQNNEQESSAKESVDIAEVTQENVAHNQTKIQTSTDNKIEIVKEYSLYYPVMEVSEHFIIVKNNSDSTVEVSSATTAYDESGKKIGTSEGYLYALGAGCTSIIDEMFDTKNEAVSYETIIETTTDIYSESILQDLEYTQTDIEDGAIFEVTNVGEDKADFVTGYALFLKDGQIVDYDYEFFEDINGDLKSGKTISEQYTTYENFDTIEFYLTGEKAN